MYIYLVYNPMPNYTISHSVFLMHEQFNLLNNEDKLRFDIKPHDLTKEFYESFKNLDSNLFNNYIINNAIKPGKIIFFGRYFLTRRYLFDENFLLKLKEKHEIILWLDDLQKLFHNNVLKIVKNPDSYLKSQNIKLIDKILSPSPIFLKNINSSLIEKTIFQFYSIDHVKFLYTKPFDKRNHKILLSGYIDSSYRTRTKILKLYKTKRIYKKRIYYHEHPGYGKGNADPNYFETLQSFKYAFIGLVNYPMNYCISKITETLACGTLALIEFSPLLEEELGLKPYEHYIPIYNGVINFTELDYLRKSEKDKIIAENGQYFVLINFDFKIKILELITKIRSLKP